MLSGSNQPGIFLLGHLTIFWSEGVLLYSDHFHPQVIPAHTGAEMVYNRQVGVDAAHLVVALLLQICFIADQQLFAHSLVSCILLKFSNIPEVFTDGLAAFFCVEQALVELFDFLICNDAIHGGSFLLFLFKHTKKDHSIWILFSI